MSLTAAQKATLLEIVGLSDPYELERRLDWITANDVNSPGIAAQQFTRMATDISAWDAIKDKTALKMKGGKDGIDLDTERKINGIRNRLMVALRMEDSGGATMMVRA